MGKKINFATPGVRTHIGDNIIYRMLPNSYTNAVGPFVFLDHIPLVSHSLDRPRINAGTGAHPHRGIATLTYIIKGEGEHFDSRGNHEKIYSGGIQWMNAGNGIIHDETLNTDSLTGEMLTQGFQFWINLPSKIKAKAPEYLSIHSTDVPLQILPDNTGWLKVIVGEYKKLKSKVPDYSKQLLYHIHLAPEKTFLIKTEQGWEYAALLPQHDALINQTEYKKGDFIGFDTADGSIKISNNSKSGIDVLLFGGEKCNEPIVAQGPFVMNSQNEIAQAYRDFYAGNYGQINYGRLLSVATQYEASQAQLP